MLGKLLNKPHLAIILTIIVSILCFMPSEKLPDGPDDKTSHFLAFGALAFFWYFYSKAYLKVFVGLCVFAVFIEIVQKNLPEWFHRGFELLDIAADILGIFIGFAGVFLFKEIQKKWPSIFN